MASGSRSRPRRWGQDIVQLHPLDVGVLLELDAFLSRDRWFWDDLPAARGQASQSSKVDDIVAVDTHAADRAVAGQSGELCHTLIRFVLS